jgi:hypothetical protein
LAAKIKEIREQYERDRALLDADWRDMLDTLAEAKATGRDSASAKRLLLQIRELESTLKSKTRVLQEWQAALDAEAKRRGLR